MSMELDNQTFQTMPKPPRIPERAVRKLTRFERWAWSPVVSFQIGLTAGYLGMIFFGVSAFIANIPVFEETAPDGWSQYWGAALVTGGILGAIGSIDRHKVFEMVELFGAAATSLSVGTYALSLLFMAYTTGDNDRAAIAAAMVALTLPVLVRTLWLSSQSLRK